MPSRQDVFSRALAGAIAAMIVFAGASPAAHGAGSAPAAPELVAPANGASVAVGTALTVRATDPDDASLDVTFHGAARSATPPPGTGEPFTFVVLPDTQNYVITPTNSPVMATQLQWIVDQRSERNIAFVAGVGDIVDNYTSAAQWGRVTTNMAILDDAGVPSAVLPGNHDFNLATGDFTGYNTYFPVSRYRDASWNSPTASYGGYYGQNQFGPDAADRQNMNNYSLFTAGGMDFMLLSLELNAPDPVIAWAQRVLDAHPDRRAIVATHSYLSVNGTVSTQVLRTDVPGNSGVALWQKLIYPNCSIFMVVSGHFTDGINGEANRTDPNACGKPVHAALSDFQGRPHGGDGWLRYYTFTPAANEIRASTYSPSLGQQETDANSSFVLSYDMTPPAELPQIGTATVAAGGTASVALPDLPVGTVFDWYATVSDGTTVTRGPAWSVTVAPPAPTAFASDSFARALGAGWGSAETGGPWTVNATAKFTVAGGVGRVAANAGSTLNASLEQVSRTATDVQTTIALDKIPNQPLSLTVAGRVVGTALYGARVRTNANGTVQLHVMRDGTALAGTTSLPGVTWAAGTRLRVRVQVEGTSPTVIRTRAWPNGSTEPTTWQYTATDTTAALQKAGGLRLSTYLAPAATNGPVVVSYDDYTATPLGGTQPPANTPPVAAFTWTASGLTVTADSSTSTDSDGTIVTRTWNIGGTTSTGTTATATFPAAGTYPVSLTVVDDDGASTTSTQNVTVSEAPVNTPPVAAFTWTTNGLTVTADSTTSSDSDGTIATRTWDLGGVAATGVTATRTFPAAGTYPITLSITDDDGAPASVTQNVTVTAPSQGGTLAADAFGRTVSSGWGSADTGGAWTVNSAAKLTVSGGVGRVAANAGSTLTATLGAVSSSATDARVTVAVDRMPNQYLSVALSARVVGTSTYGAALRINPNGSVLLQAVRDGTALAGGTVAGLTVTPGASLNVRTQVQGTNSTAIRVRVWLDGAAEPSTWQYTATDSTAALQQPGGVRLSTYLSSGATNGPVLVTYDNLAVTAIP